VIYHDRKSKPHRGWRRGFDEWFSEPDNHGRISTSRSLSATCLADI
jgi:hypothetical protein